MYKLICGMALLMLIAGCNGSESPDMSVVRCSPAKELLSNAVFASDQGGSLLDWNAAQHAGEESFELSVDSEILEIKKVGTQPWFTLTQKLDGADYVGKKIDFSAEIKLNLNQENLNHAFLPGGGLLLLVYGDLDPIGGDRLLLDLSLQHEPKLGVTDWQQVSLSFQVPEKTTRILYGFLHRANGNMFVRNPSLLVCEDS